MQSTSIIRRWIRGSLLITVLVLVLAEGLFLYYSYNDLYGGVERAVENRFSTDWPCDHHLRLLGIECRLSGL